MLLTVLSLPPLMILSCYAVMTVMSEEQYIPVCECNKINSVTVVIINNKIFPCQNPSPFRRGLMYAETGS